MTQDKEIVANHNTGICRIFVVRHARTDWNSKKILQGHIDIDINADGCEQAQKLANHIHSIPFDQVISSDLSRCVSTVAELKKLGPLQNYSTTQDLRERNMGEVQGMPLSEALEKYGKNFRDFGEKEHELIDRVSAVWDQAISDSKSKNYTNTMLCTHGGVITAFTNHLYRDRKYALAEGIEADDLRVPYNTSITVVDIDKATGQGIIQKFGVTEHLGGDFRVKNQLLR